MAKKPSSGWERTQVDEWAFSVAALGWDNDRYWQCSRGEFLEIKKAYARLHGIEVDREMTDEEGDSFSNYLSGAFGGKTETNNKNG